ncbi:MAG TPA: amino acid permease, partial [Hyphomicrobiaceae bacterium]|nr:amino acid permease [Hyphomicrobiaceae bacterium]
MAASDAEVAVEAGGGPHRGLARRVTLPLAILFGLGVTIGAGIYVLIGAAAGRAGMHAPLAFVLAAIVMVPTAAAFAEFATRMPVSAGEAAYARAGFNSQALALLVGLMVIAVGILSAAAISRGSSGYIRELTGLPLALIVPLVVLAMGAITAIGIKESVGVAAVMTVIEIGGLLAIIVLGGSGNGQVVTRLPEIWTGLTNLPVLLGILSATLLAFFAFIGFEGLANIAEEVEAPERTLPLAIFWTLVLSTILYIAVVWVALIAVPRDELAAAEAPLSLVFKRVTSAPPVLITTIAIVATVNGIIAQMIMASRVVYGLADRGQLPKALASVHLASRSPRNAIAMVVVL